MAPFSTKLWDTRIPPYVKDLKDSRGGLTILDVGAGAGKWADLLKDYYSFIDAVEIREPYIEQFGLEEKYDSVFNIDIMDFDDEKFSGYDLVILGDIFEHLSVKDAKVLLKRLKHTKAFIMVPFETEQGECYGNTYETHLQPDLTEEVMKERYPELEKVFVEGRFGFYTLN